MVVAVTGATGRLGSCVTSALLDRGHEVRRLSRHPAREFAGAAHYGVDLSTGAGLEPALAGADVVIDAANSNRHAEQVLVNGTRRLSAAAQRAGVRHHVLCSIVGIEAVPASYYRAKVAQEEIVISGPTPWSILRATQFHPLVDAIFTAAARLAVLPAPAFPLQPIDPREVARALVDAAESAPLGERQEIAGPEVLTVRELARQWRRARGRRAVLIPVPLAGAAGRALRRGALTSSSAAAAGSPTFEQWLREHQP